MRDALRAAAFHLSLIVTCIVSALPAAAQVIDDASCRRGEMPPALRQTLVVVDGALLVPEVDGKPPRDENQSWRRFAAQFVDAAVPGIGQRMDARERVTLAIANADGSGLTVLFSGCVPLFRPEEEQALDSGSSALDRFFGSDWRSTQKKAAEEFRRKATLAMVTGIRGLPPAEEGAPAPDFARSGLARSLARGTGTDLSRGVPRLVLYTDLSRMRFPAGEVTAARAAARAEADASQTDLQRAEVHVFGAPGAKDTLPKNYLEAYLLAARGRLATFAAASGAMPADPPPRQLAVYQGKVRINAYDFPVLMRLARDQNGGVVNSWMEMRATVDRDVPFRGVVSCAGPRCTYIGDKSFAQVWSDNPDPDPQFEKWMPFLGLRDLSFTLTDEGIEGTIRDEVGYVEGQEGGLALTLARVPNGVF